MSAAIAEIEKPITQQSANPMAILQLAMEQKADIDKLTKLWELQEKWEAQEAKKEFNQALSEFKENVPTITKNKLVSFPTSKGTTEYSHATLDHVCEELNPVLSKFGLLFRWKVEQLDGGIIRVGCVLSHTRGHSETTSIQSVPDQSGSKNAIQAVGSTITYLQRYSLLAATGMATQGQDDDGAGADADPEIGDSEIEKIVKVLNDTKSDWEAFYKRFQVADVCELRESQLPAVWEALNKKLAQRAQR